MDSDPDLSATMFLIEFPFKANIASELSSNIIFWLYICSFDGLDLISYQKSTKCEK